MKHNDSEGKSGKRGTLGGSKASISASEALGNLSLTVLFSFFLSAPDSLWCDRTSLLSPASLSLSLEPYDDFCQSLARELPAVVVSVNYRLAPEHRYPCQYDDGFDVLKFIDDSQSSLFEGANLRQCFLAGDIAHHVAIRASGHEFRDLKVVGILAIQPFFGGEERTESETRLKNVPLVNVERTDWMWKAFLPGGGSDPVVNVFGPNAVDSIRYYEGLKKRGKQAELVVFPNAIHAGVG